MSCTTSCIRSLLSSYSRTQDSASSFVPVVCVCVFCSCADAWFAPSRLASDTQAQPARASTTRPSVASQVVARVEHRERQHTQERTWRHGAQLYTALRRSSGGCQGGSLASRARRQGSATRSLLRVQGEQRAVKRTALGRASDGGVTRRAAKQTQCAAACFERRCRLDRAGVVCVRADCARAPAFQCPKSRERDKRPWRAPFKGRAAARPDARSHQNPCAGHHPRIPEIVDAARVVKEGVRGRRHSPPPGVLCARRAGCLFSRGCTSATNGQCNGTLLASSSRLAAQAAARARGDIQDGRGRSGLPNCVEATPRRG